MYNMVMLSLKSLSRCSSHHW